MAEGLTIGGIQSPTQNCLRYVIVILHSIWESRQTC